MNYKKVIQKLRNNLADYLATSSLNSVVVGVSGGIDSALVCALAKPACDNLIMSKVKLIGRSLPILSNKPDEVERAKRVGENFCDSFETSHCLEGVFNKLEWGCLGFEEVPPKEELVRLGNIKARLRMIYLYDLAQKNKGLVLSTDNYTEYLLGFWTLHGDVGDYGLIQNLWKTEVYEMAKWIVENEGTSEQKAALQVCIDAVPTDGLGITNSDFDQLGANSYEEIDGILKPYMEICKRWYKWPEDEEKAKKSYNYYDHPVIRKFETTHFKRNNPTNCKIGRSEQE